MHREKNHTPDPHQHSTQGNSQQLVRIVRGDDEQIDRFLDDILFQASLECVARSQLEQQGKIKRLPPNRNSSKWIFGAGIAAGIAATCTLGYTLVHSLNSSDNTAEQPVNHAIDSILASITETNKEADRAGFQIGALLKNDLIEVPRKATLSIAMRDGALVSVNGPARLSLTSTSQIDLNYGRIKVYAPSYAKGFTVQTAEGKIVDLGTKFVIAKSTKNRMEVHVDEGVVEVQTNTQENQKLIAGNAIEVVEGEAKKIVYRANRFEINTEPELSDTDLDGFVDVVEQHYKTDPNNPISKPSELLLYDGFSGYPQGGFDSSSHSKIQHWVGRGAILETGLSYKNKGGSLSVRPGCIQTNGSSFIEVSRILERETLPPVGTFYISFLMRLPKIERGSFAGLMLYNGRESEKLFVGKISPEMSFGSRNRVARKQDGFSVAADNDVHFFVIRMDQTKRITDIFLDPLLGQSLSKKPSIRYQNCEDFDRISMRSGWSHQYPVTFDEIRIGLTSEAVMPIK